MTISSTTIRADYSATSPTTGPFGFNFNCSGINSLEVIQTDTYGNDTILSLNTGYTIVGILSPGDYSQGANITLINALLAGEHLAIISNVDGTQDTSIKDNQRYYAYVHEAEFDTLATKDLQQQEQINKSIKAPDSEPAGTVNLTLPSIINRASKFLGFDVLGNVSLSGVINTVINSFWATLLAFTNEFSLTTFLHIPTQEFQESNLNSVNSPFNDYNPGGSYSKYGLINIIPQGGNIVLTGMYIPYGISTFGTQRTTIFNESSYTITLKHNDGQSATSNRFFCPGAIDFVLAANTGVDLIYAKQFSSPGSAWLVIS
jgi:hypothetical protein